MKLKIKLSISIIFFVITFSISYLKNRNESNLLFKRLMYKNITSLTITSSSNNIRLKNDNNRWLVSIHSEWIPCDNKRVIEFINKLNSMKIYSETGKTDDIWNSFGVDDKNAIKLAISGINYKTILFLGERVAGSNHIFIRKKGDIKTYEADIPGNEIYADVYYWIQLRLFDMPINPEEITNILFRRTDDVYSLIHKIIKKEDIWELQSSAGAAFLTEKSASKLILKIINYRGSGIEDITKKEQLISIGKINMVTANRKEYIINFFKDLQGNIYCNANTSPYLYTTTKAAFRGALPEYIEIINKY